MSQLAVVEILRDLVNGNVTDRTRELLAGLVAETPPSPSDTCSARVDALLSDPNSQALEIELELARQVREGETDVTAPPTGFSDVEEYKQCLAHLEARYAEQVEG